jgi:hypothetical protein
MIEFLGRVKNNKDKKLIVCLCDNYWKIYLVLL